MRVYASAVSALMLVVATEAFVSPSPSFLRLKPLKANSFSEFDYLLGEGNEYVQNAVITTQRRVVHTSIGDGKAVVQHVSDPAAGSSTVEGFPQPQIRGTGGLQEQTEEYDPYDDESAMDPMQQKLQEIQANKGIGNMVADLSFQELMFVLIVPSIAAFAGIRWGWRRATGVLERNANEILDNYASEMIYHDGDIDEMRLCHNDYKKRLLWLGPKKKEIMLKHYLEAYSKKKVVSPQSISSLSNVFMMYKLSEEKTAEILVSLCKKMGKERISSTGKLLFFGNHILKSPEGKAALRPIKQMIMDTYRDKATAEEFVDAAQTAMGEAAYRHQVQAAGRNQKSLTPGWQTLGLERETAERIFAEEAEEGFVSDREAMYGGQAQKYDKKGRAIDKDGKVVNPEEAEDDDFEDDEEGGTGTGSVFECGECGYTLFVAKGREFKFFGDDFECPECGAKKDSFVSRDTEE